MKRYEGNEIYENYIYLHTNVDTYVLFLAYKALVE